MAQHARGERNKILRIPTDVRTITGEGNIAKKGNSRSQQPLHRSPASERGRAYSEIRRAKAESEIELEEGRKERRARREVARNPAAPLCLRERWEKDAESWAAAEIVIFKIDSRLRALSPFSLAPSPYALLLVQSCDVFHELPGQYFSCRYVRLVSSTAGRRMLTTTMIIIIRYGDEMSSHVLQRKLLIMWRK